MKLQINSAQNVDSFVGIKVNDGIPNITFPYGVDISNFNNPKTLNRNILLLIKAISYAKSIYKEKVKLKEGGKFVDGFPLFDFIWLLSDYISNGLFQTKEKNYNSNAKGKINWKRTLRGSFTISSGNVIYDELITEKYFLIDNQITKIHAHCVYEANKICGWFFGNIDVPRADKLLYGTKRSIHILKQRLVNTFDDRTKMLLNAMINILSNSYSEKLQNSIYEFGTYKYEIVWELIIDKIFSNTDISKFYPSARYRLVDGREFKAKSYLRPDTIILKDNNAFIIDSKYYKFGITDQLNDLPATADIQKQIAYGEFVNTKFINDFGKEKPIYNLFILPYNSYSKALDSGALKGNMEFVGEALGDWISLESSETFKKIQVILVDGKFALEAFSNLTNEKTIDNLMEIVLKNK